MKRGAERFPFSIGYFLSCIHRMEESLKNEAMELKEKGFWKGFCVALALVLAVSIAWKPVCRIIPWHLLPFSMEMPREAKLELVEGYLEKYYVDEVDETLVDDMLYTGMLAGVGDRYTYYLTADSLGQYMENTNGHFDGVGIEVYSTLEGEVTISRIMEGEPAEKVGLAKGDVIIGVDGEDMRGMTLSDVAARIRGEAGTEVRIEVLRKSTGETLEFTIVREDVVLQSVESRMLETGIGYIALSGFKENTYEKFKEELDALQAQGMKGLILDLRNNPGGLMRSVYEIGEELLPAGTMVYTLDKEENRSDLKCDDEYLNMPLVVLVNGGSASASEILSGAVKDHNVGTLIGTQTFGKGLVQRLFTLPDGSGLNITIQKYYTPNGVSIQDVGVSPDIVVELPEAYQGMGPSEIPEGEDSQLKKALEVMRGKIS